MKKCIICGKNIRTGHKYCYEHRNGADNYVIKKKVYNEFLDKTLIYMSGIAVSCVMFFSIFGYMGFSAKNAFIISLTLNTIIVSFIIKKRWKNILYAYKHNNIKVRYERIHKTRTPQANFHREMEKMRQYARSHGYN